MHRNGNAAHRCHQAFIASAASRPFPITLDPAVPSVAPLQSVHMSILKGHLNP